MHFLKINILIFLYILNVSSLRVHLQENGCIYRYSE